MSEDVRRMVGRNVQRLRIDAGLSQAALAERMGVDRAYVSGLELGQRNPTIVSLWHVAEALGVKLQHFFEEEVNSPQAALVVRSGKRSKAGTPSAARRRNAWGQGRRRYRSTKRRAAPAKPEHAASQHSTGL